MSEDFDRLTRRELHVAVLVAKGLSDREIAQRLVIAKRTAEWHAEQILGKLGLKSRSQIAARVAEAEALGSSLLAEDPSRNLSTQAAAFLGYKAEFSQTHELLETTRLLTAPPGETDSRRRERLISLVDSGYNPVIVGLIYTTALRTIAKQYPDTQFAIVDDGSLSADNKNVTSLVFADDEGSYLVGAVAAQASKTRAIGFIGGVDIPFIARFREGYVAGARAIEPRIKVQLAYLTEPPDFSGFAHPARARVAAAEMYRGGVDAVYHAAGGSGTGLFQAAKAAGAYAIGVDSDQYLTAPADTKARILTSMLKRVDAAVHDYLRAFARNSPLGGVRKFDLANDGVDYSRSNPVVRPYQAITDDLRQRIVAGKVRLQPIGADGGPGGI